MTEIQKKREKPRSAGWRVYNLHRKIVRTRARRDRVSDSEVVRRAIEQYQPHA